MVCHAEAMVGKEKIIGRQIVIIPTSTSIGFGFTACILGESTRTFLSCMGKMELFIFDLSNPFLPFLGGDILKLPKLNLFRLSIYFVGYAFIVIVPILYYKIFMFRKKQDMSITGKETNQLKNKSHLKYRF